MSAFLSDLLAHTPTAVWVGLAVIVVLGWLQTRPRDVSARRLWAVPLVLGALSLASTWHAFAGAAAAAAVAGWLAGAGAGVASKRGLALPRELRVNPDGSLRLGGSIAPLLLFLWIFLLRYAVAVALALHPALTRDPLAAVMIAFACGLPTGLLAARARRLLAARRVAPALAAA